jgi:hypothetical protein
MSSMGDNWRYKDKGWQMLPSGDRDTSRDAERHSCIVEEYALKLCFRTAPDQFKARGIAAGTALDALRAKFAAWTAANFDTLADTGEKISHVLAGDAKNITEPDDELDGVLLIELPLSVTINR